MTDDRKKGSLRVRFNEPEAMQFRIYSDTSLAGTARTQIDTRAAFETKMEAHVQQWRVERKRLSMTSNNVPDYDLGSRGHRSVLSEYEERRTEWERRADKIENSFHLSRESIRRTGTTLQDEFLVPHKRQSMGRSR